MIIGQYAVIIGLNIFLNKCSKLTKGEYMIGVDDLPPSFIGHVFAHKLNYIATTLAKYQIKAAQLLQGTGIDEGKLADLEYKVDKQQIIEFYRNVQKLKISGVGLLLGKLIKCSDYGLYGCTFLSCKDLQSALAFSVRYHHIATRTVCMSLHLDKALDCAYYRFEDLLSVASLERFNIEMQCAIMLSLVRECLDAPCFVFDELRFTFDKPNNHPYYLNHFQCPISYCQSHNEFVVHRQKLQLSTSRSNPLAMPFLLDQCQMLADSIDVDNDFLVMVNHWVAANMHIEIKAEQLASYLCVSPRSLRRKLSTQGTCFRDVVREIKREAAEKLLLKTQLSIEDIGIAIGFNDVSNFRAAFKKWTGQTPSSLR